MFTFNLQDRQVWIPLKSIVQKEFNYQIESKVHLPFYLDSRFNHFRVIEEDNCILKEVTNNQSQFQGIDVKDKSLLIQGKIIFEDFKQTIA